MNKAGGFIALHRQIMNWEWYGDANTFCLFVHLLLAANYVDGRFKGKVIKRGQLVTSLNALSTNTGLTFQQTRTALNHLISTGEVTNETTPNYSVITIVKYDEYQTPTNESTNDQQTINKQSNKRSTHDLTNDQQQYNNIINKQGNKETKEQGNNDRERGTAKRFTPPTRDEILAFCAEAGLEIDVDRFLDYYESNGWMVGRNRMKDFKAAIRNWARRDRQGEAAAAKPTKTVIAQQYQQRDYTSVNDYYRDELDREMEEFMRGTA